jgi:hypothetical protein
MRRATDAWVGRLDGRYSGRRLRKRRDRLCYRAELGYPHHDPRLKTEVSGKRFERGPLDNSEILALAESALADSWRRMKRDECFRAKPVGYVNRPEDNLLSTVSLADIEEDYGGAAGHELEHKFCAPYSSAALVANCFGPFRKNGPIPSVAGANGLTLLRFEKRLPHGLRSEPPNLDVVIRGSDVLVAIESKCTEYLRGKRGEFKPAYDPLVEKMEAGWRAVFQIIREQPDHFGGLDAAQLVDRRVSQPK